MQAAFSDVQSPRCTAILNWSPGTFSYLAAIDEPDAFYERYRALKGSQFSQI